MNIFLGRWLTGGILLTSLICSPSLAGNARLQLRYCLEAILRESQAQELDPRLYAQGKIKIEKLEGGRWAVEVPGKRIEGRRIANRYDFTGANGQWARPVILLTLETDLGDQFFVLSRYDLRWFVRQWDFVPSGEEIGAIAEYPMLWRSALLYSAWLAHYSIHADSHVFVMPTLPTLNRILDTYDRTPLAVGPRFEEYRGWLGRSFEYSWGQFQKAFARGSILMATHSSYADHDMLQDHMVGALLTPPALFESLQSIWSAKSVFTRFPTVSHFWDSFSAYLTFDTWDPNTPDANRIRRQFVLESALRTGLTEPSLEHQRVYMDKFISKRTIYELAQAHQDHRLCRAIEDFAPHSESVIAKTLATIEYKLTVAK